MHFTAIIQRFDKKGEKTGWSYIEISSAQASKLTKALVSFRVKGSLDAYPLKQTALIPMGDGRFILPINATIRKATGKRHGDKLTVKLELDETKFILSPDLMECLNDEPRALAYFKTLPGAHQRYFSKWIDSAKTDHTKAKRIVMAVTALAQHLGYGEMMRMNKGGTS
ncbi:MAG: YdeI/OmpD-associated family protein [Cyclobacteriaceae bacterium]|nr:YdeI/OmpD-associated family protein [Cyclobacteriaceae bacterium]